MFEYLGLILAVIISIFGADVEGRFLTAIEHEEA
jgi:hypothetical protein